MLDSVLYQVLKLLHFNLNYVLVHVWVSSAFPFIQLIVTVDGLAIG